MPLTMLLGGARSGKSRLAVRLAEATRLPVAVVVTGWAGDAEMDERIARHRRERPGDWTTVEEQVDLGGALARVPEDACAVVDCLSFWVANLMEAGWDAPRIEDEAARAASRAAGRAAPTIAVSNEVGHGVVPVSALGRGYRDTLGRVNASWAAAADRALLVVAGRILPLAGSGDLVDQFRHETGGAS
jgi:adenosyl cobinamide kinase/adenosyl cobinamide phosphate guanylyltransferase